MDRLSRTLPWLTPFVIGLALAYAASGMLTMTPAQPPATRIGATEASDTSESTKAMAWQVAKENILDLFVPQPAKPVTQAAPKKKAPKPEGPKTWQVVGIVAGDNPVVILYVKGAAQFAAVGDVIEGWTLDAVRAFSAIWSKDMEEQVMRLTFDREAEPEHDPIYGPPKKATPKPKRPASTSSGSKRISLKKGEVEKYLKDPAAFIRQAVFKPYSKGGNIEGFRVTRIKGDSLLKKVGLRNNDVLKRINGKAVTSPTRLMEAYTGLSRASSISLDIQRGSAVLSFLVLLE